MKLTYKSFLKLDCDFNQNSKNTEMNSLIKKCDMYLEFWRKVKIDLKTYKII